MQPLCFIPSLGVTYGTAYAVAFLHPCGGFWRGKVQPLCFGLVGGEQ